MPLPDENLTPEEILAGTLRSMRDSVWAINDGLERATNGASSSEVFGVISRNVSHLELMVTKEEISGSSEDITDITDAIDAGNAYLTANPE